MITPKLTLGFSPCPNDTFMFEALVNGKIDLEGLSFEPVLEDVENLNRRALRQELDITKLSFFTFARVADAYSLLTAGSALGQGVGPLLVSKKDFSNHLSDIRTVAIPGKNTTANFLFSLCFPQLTNKVEMIFSDIEDAILEGRVDAGVIIHENRFTYEQKGLLKIRDLGEWWEEVTGQPIPLGGIAIRRSLPEDVKAAVNRVLERSVRFAFAHPESGREYVNRYAQEMSADVQRKHIRLYVNDYSINLGHRGKEAITTLFNKAFELGLIAAPADELFVCA